MRSLVWALTIAVICVLPGHALADGQPVTGHAQQATTCVMYGDDNAQAFRHAPCMIGVATRVSANGMMVRPAQSAQRKVRFTRKTLFETDSGEGGLDGLVSHDYVCVSYSPHPGAVIALAVVFDPGSMPCGSARHRSSGSDE
jgi:hypothetical protein